MTKTIETLVPDILDLFKADRIALNDELFEAFSTALSKKMRHKLEERRPAAYLRASNVGRPCGRQLWYQVNQPEKAEPLPPEAKIKFLYGDILEEMLLYLARQAGHTVEREQEEIEINGVLGHIDAVVDGVLVDCKSCSSRSFDKFKDGLDPSRDDFGYLTQLDLYLSATGISRGAFLLIDKTLGKIHLDLHDASGLDWSSVIDDKRKMVVYKAAPPRGWDEVPEGKSGNQKLGVGCSYCEFKKHCWPGLRTFLYAKGPVFLTEVVRQPDVPEASSVSGLQEASV